MTEINRISIDKLYKEDQLVGYDLHIDNLYETEDIRLKNRITFTYVSYKDEKEAIIAYVECPEDEDIKDQPAYDVSVIPIEMLKLLGSCMLNAEQLLKDIIESNEHKTEENTSDT